MSLPNQKIISTNLDDINAIRLIKFSESNKALGITNQLGHNWLWQNKYPIPVCKYQGCNYVRYSDLINHLERLFSPEVNSKRAESCRAAA